MPRRPEPRSGARALVRLLWPLLLVCCAARAGSGAPFLWELKGPQQSHYLLGSVHMLLPSDYPLPAPLEAAYGLSDVLILETDPDGLASPQLQQQLMAGAASEQGLQAEVPASVYARAHRRLAALGLPPSFCDFYRGWFCAVTLEALLLQTAGYEAASGLDLHFFAQARRDQRAVHWLETPRQQMELLTAMSAEQSRQLLASTLEEFDGPDAAPDALIRQWRSGDVAALTAVVEQMEREYPAAYRRMLADRNRRWLPQLEQAFRGKDSALVVVGAAHLVGDDGLVAVLAARGFRPTPVRCQNDAAWQALCRAAVAPTAPASESH